MDINPQAIVMLPCLHCGHKFEYRVIWLKEDPNVTCPKRAKIFKIDSSELFKTLDDVEDRFRQIFKKRR